MCGVGDPRVVDISVYEHPLELLHLQLNEHVHTLDSLHAEQSGSHCSLKVPEVVHVVAPVAVFLLQILNVSSRELVSNGVRPCATEQRTARLKYRIKVSFKPKIQCIQNSYE